MSDDKNFSVSRRKALAGIGTIGAATALGGLGTMSAFTDTEDAQIDFTAGGIDGTLTAHLAYNGEDVQGGLTPEIVEEGAGVQLVLDDVKPGDFGSLCFDLTVTNNPAWLASCIGIEVDEDHDSYEPEVAADAEVSPSDVGVGGGYGPLHNSPHGELAENLLVIPFYRDSCPSNFWDPDGLNQDGEPQLGAPHDVSYSDLLSVNAVGTNAAFWNSREGTEDFAELQPLTLREAAEADLALDTIEWNNPDPSIERAGAPEGSSADPGCVFLDGAAANSSTNNDDREASPLQPGDVLSFGYDWHIPFGVGNDVQGDRVVANLGFTFAQLRHTEAPEFSNVYSPGSNAPSGT